MKPKQAPTFHVIGTAPGIRIDYYETAGLPNVITTGDLYRYAGNGKQYTIEIARIETRRPTPDDPSSFILYCKMHEATP